VTPSVSFSSVFISHVLAGFNKCVHTQKKKGVLFGRKHREYPVEYEGQTFPFGKLILIAEIKNFCGVASFKSGLSDTRPAKFSDSARTRFHLYSFFGNNFTLDHNKLSLIVQLLYSYCAVITNREFCWKLPYFLAHPSFQITEH